MSCPVTVTSGSLTEVSVEPVAQVLTVTPLPAMDTLPAFGGAPDMPAAPIAPVAAAAPQADAPTDVSVDFIESPVPGIVSSVLGQSSALAMHAQENALSTIELLADYGASFAPLVAPVIPVQAVTIAPLGTAPTTDNLTPNFATAPEAPNVANVPLVTLPDPPQYDLIDPTLIDIALPDPFDTLLPVAPEMAPIPTAIEPDFTLPAAPTLFELSLPDAPSITLPVFDAVLEDAPGAPNAQFIYADVQYQSALLAAMTERLAGMTDDMSDTGIAEAVEQAIWQRADEREALMTYRATGEALRLMKARGFMMPEASLVRVIEQAMQGGLRRSASLQRDILVEQAQLRQQNFKFATETMVALQSRLMDQANAAQVRALDAAKAVVTTEIQLLNAQVQLFNAAVSAFAVRAQVFKQRLTGALAIIEVYKAELEGQAAIGEINMQKASIYKAQVSGVILIAETYKSRVEAAKMAAESNMAIVGAYRSRVGALEAQVAAKATEYDVYSAQVKGQAAKVSIYAGQIRAYGSRVQAFDGLVRAKIGVQELRFKQANEFPLTLYQSQMDAYRIGAEAAVDKLRATATVFDTRVRAFATEEGAKATNVEAQIKVANANTMAALSQADVMIEAARANLQVADKTTQTAQNNLRTAGQLTGQLAAAATASQSVHASITESGMFSVANSDNTSATTSASNSSLNSFATSSTNSESNTTTTGLSLANTQTTSDGRSLHRGFSRGTARRQSISNSTRNTASNARTVATEFNQSISSTISCEDITTHSD